MVAILLVGLINLAVLILLLVQTSGIINALEVLLSEKDSQNSVQSVDYEDDLSLRLREFQKMTFGGRNGKKNEKQDR